MATNVLCECHTCCGHGRGRRKDAQRDCGYRNRTLEPGNTTWTRISPLPANLPRGRAFGVLFSPNGAGESVYLAPDTCFCLPRRRPRLVLRSRVINRFASYFQSAAVLLFERYSAQVWVGFDIHWLLNDSVICAVGPSEGRLMCGRKLLWRKIGLRAGPGCSPAVLCALRRHSPSPPLFSSLTPST